MGIIERLKTDRKFLFLIFGLIIAFFVIPYIFIPGLILWWFYKKSPFSRKAQVLTTAIVGSIFVIGFIAMMVVYSRDAEPSISLTEPTENISVQTDTITLKGTYSPEDRKVWVNGERIDVEGGSFETQYSLTEGENNIEVAAGDWKRARANIIVIRQLTEEEKAAKIIPTAIPTLTSTPTQNTSKTPVQKQAEPTSQPHTKLGYPSLTEETIDRDFIFSCEEGDEVSLWDKPTDIVGGVKLRSKVPCGMAGWAFNKYYNDELKVTFYAVQTNDSRTKNAYGWITEDFLSWRE